MCLVQRSSFPSEPKPSVELESAIHAQIIANSKEYEIIVNLAKFLLQENRDSNSFFSYLPIEICCKIISYCSSSIPLEAAGKIVQQHLLSFQKAEFIFHEKVS